MPRKILLLFLLMITTLSVFSDDHWKMSLPGDGEPAYTEKTLNRAVWMDNIPQDARAHFSPEKRYREPYRTDLYLSVTVHDPPGMELWFLEFLLPFEWISIHYQNQETGEWVSLKTGDQVSMKDRDIQHRMQAFPVFLKQGTVLYLHFIDYQKKAPDFRILSPGVFITANEKRDGLLMFGLSLVLFTGLYHFFRFFLDHNRYYLYYGLVLFFEMIANLGKLRLFSFLFAPFQSYGYFLYIFCNSIAVICGLSFCLSFFEIPRRSFFDRVLRYLRVPLIPVALVSIVFPYPVLGDLMNLFIVPALVIILLLTILRAFRGGLSSKLILYSFIPLLVGVIWENANVYLDYDPFVSINLIQLVVLFLHIVLMSLGSARKDSELKKSYQHLQDHFSNEVNSEVHKRTLELETHASRDGLTNLKNRQSLDRSIRNIEANAVEYSILGIVFLDLDNFKYYNDNYGHAFGDHILKRTAQLLVSITRQKDLIFRYGGDEFLILMPETESCLVESISQRINSEFQDLVMEICDSLGEPKQFLGISIGISMWQNDENVSLWKSISQADEALLKVKKEGKNRVLSF